MGYFKKYDIDNFLFVKSESPARVYFKKIAM